jgi:predicted alpha/beta superfamily hydrolase
MKLAYLLIFQVFLSVMPVRAGVDERQVQLFGTPRVSWGYIQRFPDLPSIYIGSRTIDVLVPEEYPAYPAKRYPVLYMHDGQMLFDSSQTWNHQEWKVDETLRDVFLKTGKACIVVAIHNAGEKRYAEYFPKKPFESLNREGKDAIYELAKNNSGRSFPESGPSSDAYLRFLTEELKPLIDKSFRTLSDRENTWISGSSMGGLISMYALCEYPRVFGAATCISTHWTGIFRKENNPVPEKFLHYLRSRIPHSKTHRLLFYTGSTGLDSLYLPFHHQAVSICLKSGYRKGNNLKYKIVERAGHSENDWAKQMNDIFLFLFKKEN